jgi:hypothetical protein
VVRPKLVGPFPGPCASGSYVSVDSCGLVHHVLSLLNSFAKLFSFCWGRFCFHFVRHTLFNGVASKRSHGGESVPKEGLLWIASIGAIYRSLCVWLFWLVFGAYVLTKGEWSFCKTFIAFVNEITCNSPVRLREKKGYI